MIKVDYAGAGRCEMTNDNGYPKHTALSGDKIRDMLNERASDWIDELFIPIREIAWLYHEDLDNGYGTDLMERIDAALEQMRAHLEKREPGEN